MKEDLISFYLHLPHKDLILSRKNVGELIQVDWFSFMTWMQTEQNEIPSILSYQVHWAQMRIISRVMLHNIEHQPI